MHVGASTETPSVSRQRMWQIANPEKHAAQRAAHIAVVRGVLVRPATCSRCPNDSPHAHHDDYSKPLDVTWLCKDCHVALHAAKRADDPEVCARREASRQQALRKRRERARAEESRARCQSCGDLCGIGARDSKVCRSCVVAARQSRRARIAAMWADGITVAAMAAALDSTPGAVGVEMARMRRDGWKLAYRRAGWARRVDAAAEKKSARGLDGLDRRV